MLIFCFVWLFLRVHCYVIHVDSEPSLGDLFVEHGVHHGLEGGWRVGQSEEHYRRFEESPVGDKGGFMSVLFNDLDRVVPPLDVNTGDELCISQVVDELQDKW